MLTVHRIYSNMTINCQNFEIILLSLHVNQALIHWISLSLFEQRFIQIIISCLKKLGRISSFTTPSVDDGFNSNSYTIFSAGIHWPMFYDFFIFYKTSTGLKTFSAKYFDFLLIDPLYIE